MSNFSSAPWTPVLLFLQVSHVAGKPIPSGHPPSSDNVTVLWTNGVLAFPHIHCHSLDICIIFLSVNFVVVYFTHPITNCVAWLCYA